MMPGALRSLAGLGIVLGLLAVVIAVLPQGGGADELIQVETRAVVGGPRTVTIDIKPGSYPNSINLKSEGVIPVAILTTDTFDAATVDPATVIFAGAAALHSAREDVDDDEDTDPILHFDCQQVSIVSGATEACLQGRTYQGASIEGCDSVRIVPLNANSWEVAGAVATPVPAVTPSPAPPSSPTAARDVSSAPVAPPPAGGDGAGSWKDGWPWWAGLALGVITGAFIVGGLGWVLGAKRRNGPPSP